MKTSGRDASKYGIITYVNARYLIMLPSTYAYQRSRKELKAGQTASMYDLQVSACQEFVVNPCDLSH